MGVIAAKETGALALHDAHIAEIARLSGAKVVVTDNRRHFLALARHGIRVLGAEEFARSTRFAR